MSELPIHGYREYDIPGIGGTNWIYGVDVIVSTDAPRNGAEPMLQVRYGDAIVYVSAEHLLRAAAAAWELVRTYQR